MFFFSSFVWTWGFWTVPLATARGWITLPTAGDLLIPLLVVGAFGPSVAAFALSYRQASARELFRRALHWKIPPAPLLTAFLLSPLLAAIAVWVRSRQGGAPFVIQVDWQSALVLVFFLFFLGGSLNEEFGWAYAIDRMQPRWGFVKASLLLGCVWACWHLPLFFMPTQSQSHMAFWAFLLTCCSFRLLFVWAYNRARQSVLVTLLFHTSMNFTLNMFTLLDPTTSSANQPTWTCYTLSAVISAFLVGMAVRGRADASNVR